MNDIVDLGIEEMPQNDPYEYEQNEHILPKLDEKPDDHKKSDKAISVEDQVIVVKGKLTIRKPTAGWEICSKLNNGTKSFEKSSNLKNCTQWP